MQINEPNEMQTDEPNENPEEKLSQLRFDVEEASGSHKFQSLEDLHIEKASDIKSKIQSLRGVDSMLMYRLVCFDVQPDTEPAVSQTKPGECFMGGPSFVYNGWKPAGSVFGDDVRCMVCPEGMDLSPFWMKGPRGGGFGPLVHLASSVILCPEGTHI